MSWIYPSPMPVANKGLVRDSCHPGGDWLTGWGVDPINTPLQRFLDSPQKHTSKVSSFPALVFGFLILQNCSTKNLPPNHLLNNHPGTGKGTPWLNTSYFGIFSYAKCTSIYIGPCLFPLVHSGLWTSRTGPPHKTWNSSFTHCEAARGFGPTRNFGNPQHLYPAQSLTWNLKMTPWNRFRTWKPSFLGFMLNLGECKKWIQKNLPLASVKLPTPLQTCTNHQISSRFFGFPGEGWQQTPDCQQKMGDLVIWMKLWIKKKRHHFRWFELNNNHDFLRGHVWV